MKAQFMSDEDELAAIRRKKMAAMLNMKKQQEVKQDIQQDFAFKKDLVLKSVLQPDAWAYLQLLRKNNPPLAQQIIDAFITPDVEMKLDLIMSLLAQGRIRSQIIPVDEIQYLERQFLGIKSKIQVKRRGEKEAVDLNAFLKES